MISHPAVEPRGRTPVRKHRGEVEGYVSELGRYTGDVVQRRTGVVVEVRLHVARLDLPGFGGEQAGRHERLPFAAHHGGARRQRVGIVKLLVTRPRHGSLEVGDTLVAARVMSAAEVATRVDEEAEAPLGLPGTACGPYAGAWFRRDLPWGKQPHEALHPPLSALVREEAECLLAVDAVDCRIVRRSTVRTMFPGRQISRAAFAQFAAAHNWHQVDPDIVEQVSGGGLEARSRCQQVTVLAFHSPGVDKNFAFADDAIGADVDEGWVLGPFPDVPPFEPMRCLPRNVILSLKPKVAADGTFALVTKARVSTHASHGIAARGTAAAVDSPNAGLAKGEKTVALPTVQRHAEGAAVVDAFGNGDDLRAELACLAAVPNAPECPWLLPLR
jgi:hypothetical protein